MEIKITNIFPQVDTYVVVSPTRMAHTKLVAISGKDPWEVGKHSDQFDERSFVCFSYTPFSAEYSVDLSALGITLNELYFYDSVPVFDYIKVFKTESRDTICFEALEFMQFAASLNGIACAVLEDIFLNIKRLKSSSLSSICLYKENPYNRTSGQPDSKYFKLPDFPFYPTSQNFPEFVDTINSLLCDKFIPYILF